MSLCRRINSSHGMPPLTLSAERFKPFLLMILATVAGQISCPKFSMAPEILTYPQVLFSLATFKISCSILRELYPLSPMLSAVHLRITVVCRNALTVQRILNFPLADIHFLVVTAQAFVKYKLHFYRLQYRNRKDPVY